MLKNTVVYNDLQVILKGIEGMSEYDGLAWNIVYALTVYDNEKDLKDFYRKEVVKMRKVVGKQHGKNIFAIGKAKRVSGRYNDWYLDVE